MARNLPEIFPFENPTTAVYAWGRPQNFFKTAVFEIEIADFSRLKRSSNFAVFFKTTPQLVCDSKFQK